MPVHLRPSAPTARDAILCGDPGRALAIAQRVLVQPRMSNHHRGLWGYHGLTRRGLELTVQATGIGGPSAAAVVGELADLGLRRAVRVGSCAALAAGPELGEGVVVGAAVGRDGTSAALGCPRGAPIPADRALTRELCARAEGAPLTVLSVDLHRGGAPAGRGELGEDEPVVEDLQTAGLLASCRRRRIAAGVMLAVARRGGRRLEDEALERVHLRLADRAVAALAA